MSEVVGIHGISQQQSGRNQLLGAWTPALRDGLDKAGGREFASPAFDIAYYGDLFLDDAGSGHKGAADGIDLNELDEDMLAFLARVESEAVREEVPSEFATKGFPALPEPVARLGRWLDYRFGIAGRLLFFGDLVQVRRYQRDDELAERVQGRVEEIASGAHVVVGHSLGSVVAYEYLCRAPDNGVHTLVTLGSPLGLRSIRDGLRTRGADGAPAVPQVAQWVNIYDSHDPVALGGGLAGAWPVSSDRLVDNGHDDPHAVLRYLGKPQTGEAVVEALSR